MPYTRTWDEAVPPGSAARNTVATIFRNLKVDLRERFETGLVVDFDADPVVPQASVLGNVVGKLMNIHWSAFIPMGEFNTNWNLADGYIEDTSGGSTQLYAPLTLPPGTTITDVSFRVFPNGGGVIDVKMFRIAKATGVASDVVGPLSSSGTINQTLSSGVIAHVVDADYVYGLKLTSPGSPARFWWASLTYNTPDSRSTV